MNITLQNSDTSDLQGKVVLIFDNESADLKAVSTHLENWSLELFIANSDEGLQKARYIQPDLILLDTPLSGKDSFEICRWLKADEITQNIPIIFTMTTTNPQKIARGFEVGGVDYITKPFHAQEVRAKVKIHLMLLKQARRLQQQLVEREQLEKALHESEARYRLLYSDFPVMMHSIDQAGRLISVNDHWLETLGYERDEVIGQLSINFLTEESRHYAQAVKLPEVFKKGEIKQVPYQFVKKNGEVIDVLLSAILESDAVGKMTLGLVMLVEITERKKAEEALRQSERELRLIIDNVPAMIAYIDSSRRYRLTNRRYETRYKPDGSCVDLHIWDVFGQEVYKRIKPNVDKALLGQDISYEVAGLNADGSPRWTSINYIPNFTDDGTVDGFYAMLVDITKHKLVEEKIQTLNAELEERVQERTTKLQEKIAEQRQTEEALRQSETRYRQLLIQTETTLTETKKQAKRLNLLNEMTRAFNQALDEAEVFKIAARKTLPIVGGDRAGIALLNETETTWEVFTLDGLKGVIPTGVSFPVEGTLTGSVIKKRQLTVFDLSQYDAPDIQQLWESGFRFTMVAPLAISGTVIGSINVASTKNINIYGPNEERLFQQIASLLVTSLENRRLFAKTSTTLAETEEHAKRLQLLNEMSLKMSLAQNENEVFQVAARYTTKIIGADRASVALLDDTDTMLDLVALKGDEGAYPLGAQLPVAGTVLGASATSQEVMLETDFENTKFDDLKKWRQIGASAALIAPLIAGGKVIGTLNTLIQEQGKSYIPEAEGLILQLSSVLAANLQSHRNFVQTQHALAETEEHAQRLTWLNEMSHQLSLARSEDEIFRIVTSYTAHIVSADRASVALPTADKKQFEVFALQGEAGAIPANLQMPLKDTSIGKAVTEKKLLYTSEMKESEFKDHRSLSEQGLRSVLNAPLIIGDRAIGTLNIASQKPAFYNQSDQELVLNIASFLGIAVDRIRKTKEVEERASALSSANNKLSNLNKELRHTTRELEAANQAKNIFLANMSHELRTPLNGILGYAQILNRDPTLTSRQQDAMHTIQQSGEHLLTLINDILDLARIEAGKIELYPTKVHLPTFLNTITAIIRSQTQPKNIHFSFETPRPLPYTVKVDETRLRQILLNLLGNAVKFTTKGEILLKVSPMDGAGKGLTPVRFEINDTGIGMQPEDLDKIFQPFEQTSNTKAQIKGAGLGLAITHQLVSLMGGELKVSSQVGIGSTFWFEIALPVIEDRQITHIISLPRIIGYQRTDGISPDVPLKVLVVDDVAENRDMIVDMLTPLGFDVFEAFNGQQGIVQAELFKPELIVMDKVMPILDGLESTRQLRQFSAFDETVIIVASASTFEQDQQDSLAAGANAFIAKPINLETLFQEMGHLLNLTWLYAEPETTLADETDGDDLLIPPPPEELIVLYDLAQFGNMRRIRERADYLITLDKQYLPFANKLRDLAEVFAEQKILALVEQYLDRGMENNDPI